MTATDGIQSFIEAHNVALSGLPLGRSRLERLVGRLNQQNSIQLS